jgi:integrase
MPRGWNKAFGLQMAKEIKQWLKEHNVTDYEVTDVNEKGGRLHWYDNGPTQLYSDVVVKYEIQSINTCVRCGSSIVTHVSKGYMHHEMDRGSKIAGVKRIRIHDLRHSHVSLLIDMGFTALAIADRVGHESIDITYRYAHLFPTKQKEIAEKLDLERM